MKNLKKSLAILSAFSLSAASLPVSAVYVQEQQVLAGAVSSDGTFENGDGFLWTTETSETGTGVLQGTVSDGVYSVYIENPGGTANGGEDRWDCMFWATDMTFQYGHKYRITYSVNTDTAGQFYTKLGDIDYDEIEYWHQCGNRLDMTYQPGISQAELEENLRNASLTDKQSTDSNEEEWDVGYWAGWDVLHEDVSEKLPVNEWVTYAFEFVTGKDFITQGEKAAPDSTDGTGYWAFHIGGEGLFTPPGGCFPAGTTIKFDNLALIDLGEAEETPTEPATETPTEPETETPTEPATETPTEPEKKAAFVDGVNNWGFGNSYRIFGDTYYINSTHRNALLNGLSIKEKQNVLNLLGSDWGGSCYGMASTSILSCHDILKPSDWQADASCLYDIKVPSQDAVSLIHYYFALQSTDYVQQEITRALYRSEEDKLNELIEYASKGSPTLLTFYGRFGGGTRRGGHAVVAYGVEYNIWQKNGVDYNGRILTYDNNRIDFDEDFCLYFNTKENKWAIPGYKLSSDTGAQLGMITDSLDIINYHGYLDGTDSSLNSSYISDMTSNYIEQDFYVQKVTRSTNNLLISAPTSQDEIKYFSSLSDGTSDEIMKIAFADSTKGYEISIESPETVTMDMNYPDFLMSVNADQVKDIIFEPEGCITLEGENTGYELSMIANEDHLTTDWYRLTVAGTGNQAYFEQTADGYLLKGDNLKEVHVSAYLNPDTTKSVSEITFSADSDSVLIYEINKDTIGIKTDSDGDGVYEEEISSQLLSKLGDVTHSGKIDILDVITINRAILGKEKLTPEQLNTIDFNGDGKPDTSDSLKLMKYIVGLIQVL